MAKFTVCLDLFEPETWCTIKDVQYKIMTTKKHNPNTMAGMIAAIKPEIQRVIKEEGLTLKEVYNDLCRGGDGLEPITCQWSTFSTTYYSIK